MVDHSILQFIHESDLSSRLKSVAQNSRFVLLGGAGHVGLHMQAMLNLIGAKVLVIDRFNETRKGNQRVEHIFCDLSLSNSLDGILDTNDIVVDLSADVGGIYYNVLAPAELFNNNMQITMNNLRQSVKQKIKKYLYVSSVCVYPSDSKIPITEDCSKGTEPEPTNAGYGWSKRMGEFLCESYANQNSFNVTIVRPANCYGPFDQLDERKAHVIPGLIMKALRAEQSYQVLGQKQTTRDFLYVEDFARGCLEAAVNTDQLGPFNIGTGEETSIEELVRIIDHEILCITGKNIHGLFINQGLVGQSRRCVDFSKAQKEFSYRPKVKLTNGIHQTIKWYYENKAMFTSQK